MIHVILVAEDDERIRVLVADYLQDAGFKVIEAFNAANALTLIDSRGPIDLIFSDIQMPGEMDGDALAQWLHHHWPRIPVILTSGSDAIRPFIDPRSKHRRFIRKPYALPELERQIRDLLH